MIDGYQVWKGDKSWIFDNVAALRVVSAYTQALYINGAKISLTSLPWAPGAKLADVDLDWSKINADTAIKTVELQDLLKKEVHSNPEAAFGTLVRYHWKTRMFRAQINQSFGIVQAQNLSAAKSAEDWMKGFRDSAVTLICIAGGAVGGGVALTVGAGGALVSGAIKYYDTGSPVKAGWATLGGLCMVGWGGITGGKILQEGLTKGSKAILIGFGVVFDSIIEVGGAALDGKTGEELVISGVTKAVSGAVGNKISSKVDLHAEVAAQVRHNGQMTKTISRMAAGCKAATAAAQKAGEAYAPDMVASVKKAAAGSAKQLPAAAKTAARACGADDTSILYIRDKVLAPF